MAEHLLSSHPPPPSVVWTYRALPRSLPMLTREHATVFLNPSTWTPFFELFDTEVRSRAGGAPTGLGIQLTGVTLRSHSGHPARGCNPRPGSTPPPASTPPAPPHPPDIRGSRPPYTDADGGGAVEQIGASYFPIDAVTEKTLPCLELNQTSYNIPGLLIIDTPGLHPAP